MGDALTKGGPTTNQWDLEATLRTTRMWKCAWCGIQGRRAIACGDAAAVPRGDCRNAGCHQTTWRQHSKNCCRGASCRCRRGRTESSAKRHVCAGCATDAPSHEACTMRGSGDRETSWAPSRARCRRQGTVISTVIDSTEESNCDHTGDGSPRSRHRAQCGQCENATVRSTVKSLS